eukprot:6492573-Alexandrium_andersonii.AAC.1
MAAGGADVVGEATSARWVARGSASHRAVSSAPPCGAGVPVPTPDRVIPASPEAQRGENGSWPA